MQAGIRDMPTNDEKLDGERLSNIFLSVLCLCCFSVDSMPHVFTADGCRSV